MKAPDSQFLGGCFQTRSWRSRNFGQSMRSVSSAARGAGLHHDDDREQGRGQRNAGLPREEAVAVVLRGGRDHATEDPQQRIRLGVDLALAPHQETDRGDEQDPPKM